MSMIDFDTGARSFLEFVLDHLDIAPSALAKQAGVASSTLTRFLNDDKHTFRLSSRTLEKIANSTGLDPAPFLDGGKLPEARSVLQQTSLAEGTVVTIAEVEAALGVWKVEKFWKDVSFVMSSQLPPPHSDGSGFYALVKDKSAIKIADEGDFVYCHRLSNPVSFWGKEAEHDFIVEAFWHGMNVLIERSSDDRTMVEHSLRRAQFKNGVIECLPLSDDPKFHGQSFVVDRATYETGQFRILGSAVCMVRTLSATP